MGGQYAKPRSTGTETRDGVELPAYRGDMVNDFAFEATARIPDPNRLVRAYHASSATLNLVRAFTMGGFADLRHVHDWNKGFVANSANQKYDKLAHDIDMAMKFMAACGADFDAMRTVEFFAAHEALILDYERPMTRIDSRTGLAYDTSAHFVWVGERTRDLDGAHIDFVSRIQNPIGVKVSANAEPDQLLKLLDKIDPDRVPGRVTFITRMGAQTIRTALPSIVRAGHGRRGAGHLDLRSRCTATRSRRPPATRPATSTTSSTRSAASSRSTAPSAPSPAASTSSSPATTSPSASAGRRRSSTPTWRSATSRSATPA